MPAVSSLHSTYDSAHAAAVTRGPPPAVGLPKRLPLCVSYGNLCLSIMGLQLHFHP